MIFFADVTGHKINLPVLMPATFDVSGEWLYAPGRDDNWLSAAPHGIPFQLKNHFIDLDTLTPAPHQENDEGVLFYSFEAPEEGVACLGLGLDWFYTVAVNHSVTLDLWTAGNTDCPYSPDNNHAFLPVKKGRNLLTIHTRRGLFTGSFCCDAKRVAEPQIPKVSQGPWMTVHSTAARTIRFVTDCRCGAAIQYRIVGEADWTTVWDCEWGRIIRREFHAVKLDHLKIGGRYEYRFLFILPNLPGIRCVPDEIRHFEIPSSNCAELSFFFTADLQQFDDDAEKQQQLLCDLLDACHAGNCDFFCLGGDTGSRCDIKRLFKHTLTPMIRYGLSEKPLSFLRGNHEYRGEESDLLPRYMGDENGNFYAMFRMGKCAFLVLDCYEDRSAAMTPEVFRRYNLDGVLIEQEERFLCNALNTPEWRDAEYHIVLAHGAGYSQFDPCFTMPFTVQSLTDGYFKGKHPKTQIDLWLAGHTHHYTRSIPGTDTIAAFCQPRRPQAGGKEYLFPVWTGTGKIGGADVDPINASAVRVDVKEGALLVTSYRQDGTVIEQVSYDTQGNATELVSLPHFEVEPLPPEQSACRI